MTHVGPQHHRGEKKYTYVIGFSRFSILVLLPAEGSELLKHVGDGTVTVYTFDMCWELYNKKHTLMHRKYIKTFRSSSPSSQSHVTHLKSYYTHYLQHCH